MKSTQDSKKPVKSSASKQAQPTHAQLHAHSTHAHSSQAHSSPVKTDIHPSLHIEPNQLKAWTFWGFVSLFILYALFYAFWDRSIDTWMHQTILPTDILYRICKTLGAFTKPAHWALAALVIGIFGLITRHKPSTRFGTGMILTLVVCEVLKVILARYRPDLYFQQQLYGFHFLSHLRAYNSTPSGHTASAFAGCLLIARALGNRRSIVWIALILATVIGISRVLMTEHYPSDILFGAYIGILIPLWLDMLISKRQNHLKHAP